MRSRWDREREDCRNVEYLHSQKSPAILREAGSVLWASFRREEGDPRERIASGDRLNIRINGWHAEIRYNT